MIGKAIACAVFGSVAALGPAVTPAAVPVARAEASAVPAGYQGYHLRYYLGLNYLRAIVFESPKRLVHGRRTTDPGINRQYKWYLPADLNPDLGSFRIHHAYVPNGCMDVAGTAIGSAVKVNTCDVGSDTQYWRLHRRLRTVGPTTYVLENVHTRAYLDLSSPALVGNKIARLQAYEVPVPRDDWTTRQELTITPAP